VDHIDHSHTINLAVAFVMESELVMLEPYLRDLPGDAACHEFETAGGSFQPKA
jgi:hypothetical protein